MADQRDYRRRVFRGAIRHEDANDDISCTVHELDEDGCRIRLVSTRKIPDTFTLSIAQDSMIEACRVVERKDKNLRVDFETASAGEARRVNGYASSK